MSDRVPIDPADLQPAVEVGAPGRDVARVTARRARAVALRLAGLTYQQVAEQVGYADKSVARSAVVEALREVEVRAVDELREVEAARLDRLQAAVWQAALGGDLKAVDRALRIIDARRKLLGLDAPVVVQHEGVERVDEQLAELRASLASDGTFTITDVA